MIKNVELITPFSHHLEALIKAYQNEPERANVVEVRAKSFLGSEKGRTSLETNWVHVKYFLQPCIFLTPLKPLLKLPKNG
jgi:hypothetical protein